jgi:hypothetical protein
VGSSQTLSEADRRIAAAWAADCAERVLGLFEVQAPGDSRPRDAIARTRAFARGELGIASEIRRRFVAGGAARDVKTPAAAAAARAAGQAAAVAHMGAHALGAAAYAAKAAGLAAPDRPDAVDDEIRWQLGHLSPAVRAALQGLPPVGENSSGPLGPGLLASGLLGTIIRELQSGLAESSWLGRARGCPCDGQFRGLAGEQREKPKRRQAADRERAGRQVLCPGAEQEPAEHATDGLDAAQQAHDPIPPVDRRPADGPDKNCWCQPAKNTADVSSADPDASRTYSGEAINSNQSPVSEIGTADQRRRYAALPRSGGAGRPRPLARAGLSGCGARHPASGCLKASNHRYATSASSGASARVSPMYGRASRSISPTSHASSLELILNA